MLWRTNNAFRLVLISEESLTSNASHGVFLPCDESKVGLIQVETILVKAVRSRTDKPNEKMQRKVQG